MKLLVERLDFAHSCLDCRLLFPFSLGHVLLVATSLRVANGHIEIRDLMSVLAWGWDLDWARPVEIAVTQCEGQLLDLNFLECTLVKGDEAVRR